jgi:hypothetical protein
LFLVAISINCSLKKPYDFYQTNQILYLIVGGFGCGSDPITGL